MSVSSPTSILMTISVLTISSIYLQYSLFLNLMIIDVLYPCILTMYGIFLSTFVALFMSSAITFYSRQTTHLLELVSFIFLSASNISVIGLWMSYVTNFLYHINKMPLPFELSFFFYSFHGALLFVVLQLMKKRLANDVRRIRIGSNRDVKNIDLTIEEGIKSKN
jgi:hypothetical protein